MDTSDLPAVFTVRLSTIENAITLEELEEDYGITPDSLAAAMQSRDDNPLLGVAGRCRLLNRLGAAVAAQPAWFARDGALRPGHLYDALVLLDDWEWSLNPASPGVLPQ